MLTSTHNLILQLSNNHKISESKQKMSRTIYDIGFESVVTILDYMLAILLGIVSGWAAGWSGGHIFQELFEPAYLSTFEAVDFWYYLPQTLGQHTAIIGAFISLPVYYLFSLRRINRQISEYYQKGMTKPYDLQKFTGANPARIEKVISQLAHEQYIPD